MTNAYKILTGKLQWKRPLEEAQELMEGYSNES
jgi:hypothetical protein